MIDLDNLPQHALTEQLVDTLADRINNHGAKDYLRVIVGYYLGKIAAHMRVTVTGDIFAKPIPVNLFGAAFAESGFGKTKAMNFLEREVFNGFRRRFEEDTLPVVADQHLWKIAAEQAAISGKPEQEEKNRLDKFFHQAGPLPFHAKKATASSLLQARGKLLLASVGAINIEIDEIGSNISAPGVSEALNELIELFDIGHTSVSMTRNTSENERMPDIEGFTPANLLAFGEPSRLFDGGPNEQAFMALQESGFARRLFFAWGEPSGEALPTAQELYDRMKRTKQQTQQSNLLGYFANMADPARHGWEVHMDDFVGLKYAAYQVLCETREKEIPSGDKIRRPEMKHRHWKALKLAGALAFADESTDLLEEHLLAAIDITERSGNALIRMMKRDRPHIRLAKYIAEFPGELTHADLKELSFYPTADSAQKTIIRDAQAWGYKNHIIVKKRFEDGIELFNGESLKHTDMERMILSASDHFAYNYASYTVPWEQLKELVQSSDMNWCNHFFDKEHRNDENTQPGFNMVVFDCDNGIPLDVTHDLLSEYTFFTHTTKRHTPEHHRYRLVIPMNYVLHLDKPDYKKFVEHLAEWLPIPTNLSDDSMLQRSKKWATHENADVYFNDGKLVDCTPFIPRTTRNDQHIKQMEPLGSLDNLERWFASRMVEGNRNKLMHRFAMILVDSGMSLIDIERTVLDFDGKLSNGLGEDELRGTVLRTAALKSQGLIA